jgi:hypothetical protein
MDADRLRALWTMPAARLHTAAPVVSFDNSNSYTSYKFSSRPLRTSIRRIHAGSRGRLYASTDGTEPNVLAGNDSPGPSTPTPQPLHGAELHVNFSTAAS